MIRYILKYIYIRILSYFELLIDVNPNKIQHKEIIVSMTTIPSRSLYLFETVNSILNQTVLPRKIYIGICQKSLRENKLDYNIHLSIKNHPLVEIIYLDVDFGPIMKLITGLKVCKESDRIITVDDDTIYSDRMIEYFIKENSKNPDSVLCNIGRIHQEHFNIVTSKKVFRTAQQIDSLEGYGGVMYLPQFFNLNELLNFLEKASYSIKCNDDIVISIYLYNRKRKILSIITDINEPFTRVFFTQNTNPLWIENEKKNLQHLLNLELNEVYKI